MQTALETLGLTWDTEAGTWDGGTDHPERLDGTDIARLRTDVEAWREKPIEGDREAEEDWDCFCTAVRDAKNK